MRNSGSVSQYGQVLDIMKTCMADGSYDTDNYLELNMDMVFLERFFRPEMTPIEQNLKLLRYELGKIGKPLNSAEITERIDNY